jgi:hypothetical protein
MKIGIIREAKTHPDKRTPFTPSQLRDLSDRYADQLLFFVQSSPHRCYSDEEFELAGIPVVEDISFCDLLMGIKEVPIHLLVPDKKYIFFSHTIKKQKHNRDLLRAILDCNITLLDYEVLKDGAGNRTVAFGRWAGIVGAYNGLWTYGKKSGLYDIRRAYECFDRSELDIELKKVQLPPIKIIVTGSGRVGKGILEVLRSVGISQVSPKEFLFQYYEEPVFTALSCADYNRRKTDGGYEKEQFYQFPEKYESHFLKYAEVADILMAGAYWDRRAPRLFEWEDIQSEDFNLSVIADITCDIDGSIPITIRPSSVQQPVYDIDRDTFEELPAFGKQNSISVMAIDNLPTELPRDASEEFGIQLTQHFIPELLKESSSVLEKATVAKDGDLTLEFFFLKDFVEGNEEEI